MRKIVKVRKERDYRPHTEFYHAVSVHLQHVEARHNGWHYSLLSAFLLGAFTVEAYLNYVGPILEPGWDDFEKSSPLAKLRHVASIVEISLDLSRRPGQTIVELFKFRNRLAHAHPQKIIEETVSTPGEFEKTFYHPPQPKGMAFATELNAKRCHEDVRALIELINAKLPDPDPLPLADMGSSGSASTEEAE